MTKRSISILHVGVHHALEVADERLGAAVELLVEAVDDLLLEDAGAGPLAVGAAQRDLPVGRAGLVPVDGLDELGAAAAADVRSSPARELESPAAGDVGGRVVEVDDLDRLARGQDDVANVVAVVGLRGSW